MAPRMLFALLLLFAPVVVQATNFTACYETISQLLPVNDTNATINTGPWPDPIYHGTIYGFHPGAAQRPITLTYKGCTDYCGSGTQVNTIGSAFEILTTWVLPVIALLSSLPYESNHNGKNFEAFANWIGSPAAALTTTVWNLWMIRRCQKLSERNQNTQRITRDSLFILSCTNQYQYKRRQKLTKSSTPNDEDIDRQRDKALLRGVLFPYLYHHQLTLGQPLRTKLENITFHLAFQLRLQRRRGVYPLALSIVWFLLAFVVSVVTAFAQLGDNTTAHSLALGLLLSWLPILVVATVVDRNPTSATRCGILIERWLYNVDALFAEAGLADFESADSQIIRVNSRENLLPEETPTSPREQSSVRRPIPQGSQYLSVLGYDVDEAGHDIGYAMGLVPSNESRPRTITTSLPETRSIPGSTNGTQGRQWRKESDLTPFFIQDYVAQGRRLRYCAVTDTVLDMLEGSKINPVLPDNKDVLTFKKRLTVRPFGWYITWFICQMLVTMGFGMAFLVSFNTPTIGLGCRSLAYLIWWMLSLVSWVVILLFQEPPFVVRWLAFCCNLLSFSALFIIMGFQLTGGLNRCICKSSLFGSSKYGGYMDFENGQFYHQAYDVKKYWGVAAAVGLANCGLAVFWLYHRWSRDSMIWKFREEDEQDIVEEIDLHWLT